MKDTNNNTSQQSKASDAAGIASSISPYVSLQEQMFRDITRSSSSSEHTNTSFGAESDTQIFDGTTTTDASITAQFNTMGPTSRPRPAKTFSGRMTLYFALTAFMTAVILSLVLAVVWEDQFQTYTRRGMQHMAQKIALSLGKQYSQQGAWNERVIKSISSSLALPSDVGIEISDTQGKTLYGNVLAGGKSQDSITIHTHPNQDTSEVESKILAPSGDNATASADINSASGERVGSVRLWAFGSESLITKTDDAFRKNSYAAILAAAVIAILLACALSFGASHAFTRPIKKITSTAAQIRNGDLSARTGLSGDDEIGRLGETFDSMASELERDIKFEHRLTSDVAHELRTPLMAMLATVEGMQDGVLPQDDEHYETVAQEVRRLSRLVDAMLRLSRIENGTRALKIESQDVVYLVKSLVSMQERLFDERNLRLRFDDKTTEHECMAEMDGDLIREAVTNIMSNAMRYTPAGGWVVVGIKRTRDEAHIFVSDTGIGIAKEDIPRVFARFWRSDASRGRVSGGLGIGLALTKEIIDKHHGHIAVESTLGKGTTFTLSIPLVQPIEEGASHAIQDE